MRNLGLFQLVLLICIVVSCEKQDNNTNNLSIDKISGYVQKGPYLNGSSITMSELSSDLIQTGKTYSSQILDNKGFFEMKGIELISRFVELRVDGFYFNEIRNNNSIAQLTLYALSDLTDKLSLNVNILSSLEKRRVEYLVSQGSSFNDVKSQAQSEILKIFEISKSEMMESERLDITQTGEDHAILLAVSLILQGYLQVAELSELLANLSNDIREDGELNDSTLGTILINNAKTIKLVDIRKNLEDRYETQGFDVTIPDFEKYVNQFVDITPFEFTAFIEYPQEGNYGINILDKNRTEYLSGDCSMAAILPEGTSLKVKIQGTNWFFPVSQDWSCWEKSDWNDIENSRYFTSKKTGELDFKLLLTADIDTTGTESDTTFAGTYTKTKIFVYENGVTEPTWTKEITVD